jgi:ribonuclease HI
VDDKIIIYVDGSCDNARDRIGGYGIIFEYKGKQKEVFGGEVDTTNNRMEMMACVKALEQLKQTTIPVEIYCDSAYVVNCFKEKWYVSWERNNRWKNSKKEPVENKDLWISLLSLYRKQDKVDFIKVKGHSDNELNNRCDQLANLGRKNMQNE